MGGGGEQDEERKRRTVGDVNNWWESRAARTKMRWPAEGVTFP